MAGVVIQSRLINFHRGAGAVWNAKTMAKRHHNKRTLILSSVRTPTPGTRLSDVACQSPGLPDGA